MSDQQNQKSEPSPGDDRALEWLIFDAARSMRRIVPERIEEVAHAEQQLSANPVDLPKGLQNADRLIEEIRRTTARLPDAPTQAATNARSDDDATRFAATLQPRSVIDRKLRQSGRGLSKSVVTAGIVGILIGGSIFGTAVRTNYVEATEELRQENASLRGVHDAIRKLLGAFYLPNDDVSAGKRGPAAMLSGRDTVTVSGLIDPQIIERVVVDWGSDAEGAAEEVVYPKATRQNGGRQELIAFSREHSYSPRPGEYLRVQIRAVPFDDKRDLLAGLGRDSSWLQREALFLATEMGLVVKPETDWLAMNLMPGHVVADDYFRLEGVAHADGTLVGFFQAPDQNTYLLLPPTPIRKSKRLPPINLDMGLYQNGPGKAILLLLDENASATGSLHQVEAFVPYRDSLPDAQRRIDVPIRIELQPLRQRVARYVESVGGTVKWHTAEATNAGADKRGTILQSIDLNHCPIADLRRFRGISELQLLHLIDTRVDDLALTQIAKQHPQLMYLFLGETRITDLAVIRDVVQCRNLQYLDLHGLGGISNDSVRAISENLSLLGGLDLSRTSVTSVAALKKLEHLKQLRLAGTAVPDDEVQALLKALPNVKVER